MAILCLTAGALAGCQELYAAGGVFAGVNVVSLATIHRTLPDAVTSVIRDRDCSAVHLEQGQPYCTPAEPPPNQEACTATIGTVNCWSQPTLMPGAPSFLADTPAQTPAQIANRAHHWPDL